MKVTFERLVGPEYMIPAMRVTRGKNMYKKSLPKLETLYNMILSEHSSHRAVKYRVYIEDIPYYNHVQLVRHHMGFEPHVYSQRDDNSIMEVTDRDGLPQGALINMFFDANVQALVTIARKRLCFKSHAGIQSLIKKLKCALRYDDNADDYDKLLSSLLMKPCTWFSGICPEPNPCGRVVGVRSLSEIHKGTLEHLQNEISGKIGKTNGEV